MARYTGPIQKKLRALGLDSYGAYTTQKERKTNNAMGRRRRITNYGLQLREKQKARFIYGVLERQFKNYYKKALDTEGVTGDNLMVLLERRLDNVLYRTGMFLTRRQSRQAVNHGHFLVNDRRVDIPSFQVKSGDKISWTEKGMKTVLYQFALANSKTIASSHWISLDSSDLVATVVANPTAEDGEIVVDTVQIVEFYSK